jgi:hypothetical protein
VGFSEEVMICRTPAAFSKNHGLVALTVCQDVSIIRITLGIGVNAPCPTSEKRLMEAWQSGLVPPNGLQEVS